MKIDECNYSVASTTQVSDSFEVSLRYLCELR